MPPSPFVFRLTRGGWLGLGLVLLGAAMDPPDAVTQQLDVQVNLPYAVQFGFGSYDAGGLSARIGVGYCFGDGLTGARVQFGFPF